MAVAFDASSESHTGTSGTALSYYSWTHTPSGTPKGVLVFALQNAFANTATGVSYGGYSLRKVASAVDSASEPGGCSAWLLSDRYYEPFRTVSYTGVAAGSSVAGTAAYGNGYMVKTGSGTIHYATDPTGTWSAATSGTVELLRSVRYGNGYWAAVGNSGVIRYQTSDPTGSWSGATSGIATALRGVDYGNSYWVAVGSSGVIRYKATDPTGSWSAASSPGFGTTTIRGVAYENTYWVAVADGGAIRYATDPTGTWSAATSGTSESLYGVAYGDGYWVAVGNNGTICYRATDPTGTWTTLSISGGDFERVAYAGGYWLAMGPNTATAVATTPAGPWSLCSTNQTNGGVADSNQTIFLSGSTGPVESLLPITSPINVPTGAATVQVNTAPTAGGDAYAVAITVTADYGVEAAGAVTVSADTSGGTVALAGTSVDDGSPGTNSLRFAGLFSGLSAPPTVNGGSTEIQNIDFGQQVISVIREDTAGQGSRSIGWTAAADDVAAVYLAIREAIVPWTVGVPIR